MSNKYITGCDQSSFVFADKGCKGFVVAYGHNLKYFSYLMDLQVGFNNCVTL